MEDAMTMLFTVGTELRSTLQTFQPGDAVDFTLSIESDRKWISSLSLGTPPASAQKVYVNEDWQFEDLEGKRFSLQSLQGKTVFVNHWATWCPFCISEMASIQRLMRRYAGRSDVVFILVTDESPAVVRAFRAWESL
jgi:thiol-disulfide isomerase/thioredoxin